MSRITISLPEEYATVLAGEARRLGVPLSEIVRRALARQLGLDGPRKLPFARLGRSGQRHTARDAEEILAREWGRGRARGR
jgi:hypothetical protein